jgi:hypothetical protein
MRHDSRRGRLNRSFAAVYYAFVAKRCSLKAFRALGVIEWGLLTEDAGDR